MPEICRFYGIIILMHYRDHDPPHFHAKYENQEVTIEIQAGMVKGYMGKRALGMLFEWFDLHQAEIMENWRLLRDHQPLQKIQPLS